MLTKTLNGKEIMEIIKDHLKDEGLELLSVISDDLSLTAQKGITLEVSVIPHTIETPHLYPPGYRSVANADTRGEIFFNDPQSMYGDRD